jgi:serine/threonine-protein kinase
MLPRDIEAKYEIRGTLGSGAMGVVYDALDRLIERRVAVKVVRRPPPGDPDGEEAHARFRREAQAAGRLSHPNIVGVYDYGENAEMAWIVMELVEGGSLKQRLDRQERMALPEIVRLMDQMLAALAYSHGRGVVHRDIKPGNVMLSADGTVKLADFGIARLENSSMTQVGTLMGTPSYMAPEQLRGEPVDARADIWAAGVVLYQLLTGEKPFEGGFSTVMHKALHTEPPSPSQLSVTTPRPFDAVVARAMAKRPEDRFSTAAEFAEAIRGAAKAPEPAGAGFAGAGALPGLDSDATLVAAAAPVARASAPLPQPDPNAAPQARGAPSGPRRKPPLGLILGGGGGLAAAAVAAFLLLGSGGSAPPPDADRQAQIRREAEQRARDDAERLLRQTSPQLGQSVSAPPRDAGSPAVATQPVTTADLPRPQDQQPAGPGIDTERRREAEAHQAAAEAEERRRQEQQAAERRRQQDQAAAEAERQRQQAAVAAAEADRRRQQEQAALAEAARVRQAEEAAAAERRRQQEQQLAAHQQRLDLRAAAAAAASADPCSLIAWSMTEDRAVLTGIVRRGGEAAIRQALAIRGAAPDAVELRLQGFDGPYCDAIEAIRPFAALTPDTPPRASVLGLLPLARGDLLRVAIAMPDFAGQLHVSYLMKSGEVAHLVLSQPEAAGVRLTLGEPRTGFPGWEVDEPFGTDMLLVVAADRPIFPQRRPVIEKQADYLAALSARLRLIQAQGARIMARALLVETVPQR